MEAINEARKEGFVKLYFGGYGVNISGEKMLINYLNDLSDSNVQLELIAVDRLFESAFNVFFRYNSNLKKILNTAFGMVRLPQDKEGLKEIRKEDRFKYDMGVKDNNNYIKWLEPIVFTQVEIRRLRSGKPLYFDNNRLMTIFNNNYSHLSEA